MACFALDMVRLNTVMRRMWSTRGNADQVYARVGQSSYRGLTPLGIATLSMNPAPGVPPSYRPVAGSRHPRARLAL
jgi:hypothetical protein